MTSLRLLVVNNVPAYYRIPAFEELSRVWHRHTEGDFLAVFQAQHDPGRRSKWFCMPERDLPFQSVVLSPATRTVRNRTFYSLRLGLRLQSSFRPTHLLIAGWETPAAISASIRSRFKRLPTLMWIESTPQTTHIRGPVSDRFRRSIIRSSSGILAPTTCSADYADEIAGRTFPRLVSPNPVSIDRLTDDVGREPCGGERRVIYVGDLSYRKGFDRLLTAMPEISHRGFRVLVWGSDHDGLGALAPPGMTVNEPTPLSHILPLLRPTDIWLIPSRRDPAPLTFSEALATGTRLVLSRDLAYARDWSNVPGVIIADCDRTEMLASAIEEASQGPRPGTSVSASVGATRWAQQVTEFLLRIGVGKRGPG